MMGGGTMVAAARIESALEHIDATDRETWVVVGMAINSIFPTRSGFDMWDRWSRTAENCQARAAADTWKSFSPQGGVTVATLFDMARHNGWPGYPADGWRNAVASGVFASNPGKASARSVEADEAERGRTAKLAGKLWDAASEIGQTGNPHLSRKGVNPAGAMKEIDVAETARILGYVPKGSTGEPTGRLLVVPATQGNSISNVQLTASDGGKAFLAGHGTLSCGYWQTGTGDGDTETLLIGEGVATVLTAQQSLGHGVATCSFGLSNLKKIAGHSRGLYPKADIVILADLDKKSGKPTIQAIDAAKSVNGALAIPRDESGGDDKPWRTVAG